MVAYRTVQLGGCRNVELELGRELDAAEMCAPPVPTSWCSRPARSWAADGLNAFTRGPIPGADAALPHVLTPEQVVLEGKRPPAGRVVVYDGDGYFAAPGGGRAAGRRRA